MIPPSYLMKSIYRDHWGEPAEPGEIRPSKRSFLLPLFFGPLPPLAIVKRHRLALRGKQGRDGGNITITRPGSQMART
jgi:hypothetical protein